MVKYKKKLVDFLTAHKQLIIDEEWLELIKLAYNQYSFDADDLVRVLEEKKYINWDEYEDNITAIRDEIVTKNYNHMIYWIENEFDDERNNFLANEKDFDSVAQKILEWDILPWATERGYFTYAEEEAIMHIIEFI